MNEKEKRDFREEIRSRKIVQKKLEAAIRALDKQIAAIVEDRERRKEALSQYKDERDLQDAYGWGFISEEEYDALLSQLRDGVESIEAEQSAPEIAKKILGGWLKITKSDIEALEFELLPEKKKQEIRDENYRIAMERKRRQEEREKRQGGDHGPEKKD